MPLVSRYTRQVATDPIPGVRKSAAETDLSTGAGLAQANARKFGAIANLGGAVAEAGFGLQHEHDAVARQERNRADDLVALNAENQLGTWETDRLLDPEHGAFTVKGHDALTLPDTITKEFNDTANKIEQGLTSDRQRQAFARIRAERGLSIHADVMRHVAGEMHKYEASELESTVTNASDLAVAHAMDPRRVAVELTRAVTAIRTHAPNLGFGPEAIQTQINAVMSGTHEGVIGRLLANDQARMAQVYFEEAKDQITGKSLERVEQALEVGTTLKAEQDATATILAAGGTLAEQRAKAKQLDSKIADKVAKRLVDEAALQEHQDALTKARHLTDAYAIVDAGHGADAIPPALQAELAPHMPALREYAMKRATGVPIETDQPTYHALREQAVDDPATFVAQDLQHYKLKLNERDYNELFDLRLKMKAGDRKAADTILDDFRTERDVINNALTLAGIDPTPAAKDTEGPKRVARFHGLVAAEVRRVQDITKKKATNADLEAIANRILAHQIVDEGGFWSRFTTNDFGPSQSRRSIATATVADIPPADLALIDDALRRHGDLVTDDTRLDIWLRSQVRK